MGAQLVSDHALWRASLLFHQPDKKTLGSLGVMSALDDLVEIVAILIDGAPQPVFSPANRHDDFVETPHIAGAWRFPPETAGIVRAELSRPASNRLIKNDDAALQQRLFHQPQAQRKSRV